MRYVAIINTPGYLPGNDEPAEFDTAAEAWQYLAELRRNDEDDFAEGDEGDEYSGTVDALVASATNAAALAGVWDGTGSVYGDTPGYDGEHDLGIAYSVQAVESDEDNSEGE